jgi:hypothetical protein
MHDTTIVARSNINLNPVLTKKKGWGPPKIATNSKNYLLEFFHVIESIHTNYGSFVLVRSS